MTFFSQEVILSILPCRRPRTRSRGGVWVPPVLVRYWVTTVRRTQMSRFLILNQRVQIRQIGLRKTDFWKKCQTWTALPDTESPPKYFTFGKFRKPWLGAKGHVSVITKVASARELGYDWGRSLREHPRTPGQRPASTNHDIWCWKHCVFLFRLLA